MRRAVARRRRDADLTCGHRHLSTEWGADGICEADRIVRLVNPGMTAAFFIAGRGIRAGQQLGIIDMRQIAPTVAQALRVKLDNGEQATLPVFTSSQALTDAR